MLCPATTCPDTSNVFHRAQLSPFSPRSRYFGMVNGVLPLGLVVPSTTLRPPGIRTESSIWYLAVFAPAGRLLKVTLFLLSRREMEERCMPTCPSLVAEAAPPCVTVKMYVTMIFLSTIALRA